MSQKTYNKAQCLKLLKVDAKTFDRWLKKANITPEPDTYDTRQKLITYEQLVLLADLHKRPRPPLPKEDEPESAEVTPATLDKRLAALEQMITQRLDAIGRELAALAQRIPSSRDSQTSTKTPAAPATTAPVGSSAAPTKKSAKKTRLKKLPRDFVPLSVFRRMHKVSEKAVEYAVEKKKLTVERGKWQYDDRVIMNALNQHGQYEFYELFYQREGFQRCEQCPHAAKAT